MNFFYKVVLLLLLSLALLGCSDNTSAETSMDQENKRTLMKLTPIDKQWYQLRSAVSSQNYSEADLLLKSEPKLVTHTNSIGETVLHFLAVENNIKGVDWLKSKGFSVNTKNEFGTPVIFEVAQLGYKELLVWFCENGADVLATDEYDLTLDESLIDLGQTKMAEFFVKKCT